MKMYDVAVIGAGAAGSIAAIRAGQLKRSVVLLEKNERIGKKILITGNGRCNVTNSASAETFLDKFGKSGVYLRTAFFKFFNRELMEFFKARSLGLAEEQDGCIFPETGKASSVVDVLKGYMTENNIDVIYGARVKSVKKEGPLFMIDAGDKNIIWSKKVILATGGATYRHTGSTGDGFDMARSLGHTVTALRPALVPLKTKEAWVKEAQGLSFQGVTIAFMSGKKRVVSAKGEFIFTHFGISGPLVLDLSGAIAVILEESGEVPIFIDMRPGLGPEALEAELIKRFHIRGNVKLKNIIKEFMPQRLADIFIRLLKIDPDAQASQITKEERRSMVMAFKEFPMTVTGTLPLDNAMVTAGGVSIKGIDPKTMESKIVTGLYFAGEILDGCAPSGGYNLQQAFSTGYLAGESAAICVQ